MEMLSLEELDALISRLDREPPARAEVERVLTDGYAEALELEADCILYRRALAEADDRDAERLRAQLQSAGERLRDLRTRLDAASRVFGRNPLSDPIR